jgi:hypothetical protein
MIFNCVVQGNAFGKAFAWGYFNPVYSFSPIDGRALESLRQPYLKNRAITERMTLNTMLMMIILVMGA